MIKIFLPILLFLTVNSFAQDYSELNLNEYSITAIEKDSIYKSSIDLRIEFHKKLTTEILPKHFALKKKIRNQIDSSDINRIKILKEHYIKNNRFKLQELKNNQERLFYNLTPYSRIYNILIFDSMLLFPDSYALMVNEIFSNTDYYKSDLKIRDFLYKKYNSKFEKIDKSIRFLFSDIKNLENDLKIVRIFQNTGNESEIDRKKSDLIDLLLWSFP